MLYIHADIKAWKEKYEVCTNSWFVQSSGEKDLVETGTTYYYCNRSGAFKSKSTGKRHLKTQGSSKMDAHCTASLRVSRGKQSKCIQVLVHKTHYGHKTSLGHLRIPDGERLAIAGQLAQGVTFQHVLDNIRDKLGEQFERIHLLTRKDITNIERTYGLKGIQRHKDDATSVHLWVEEMKACDVNPVILYKAQGEPQPETCDNLSKNDFLLAIQTPLQKEMMVNFTNESVICVDSTHGTNSYDFTLIIVMVADDYGEGFPVAWCISNREDQLLLINFFQVLKQRVGNLSPRWFMSDLAEQFYTAWVPTFDNLPNKLVCTWHLRPCMEGKLKTTEGHRTRSNSVSQFEGIT